MTPQLGPTIETDRLILPPPIGGDFDAFATASFLHREEISFTREEFGASAGVRRFFRPIETDISLRYQYQVLNASDLDHSPEDGLLAGFQPGAGAGGLGDQYI